MTRPLKSLTPVEEMGKMSAPPPFQGAVSFIPDSRSVSRAARLESGTIFQLRENMLKECRCDKEVP